MKLKQLFEKEFLDKKTYSPEVIAKHHGVELSQILSQLDKGIKVEQEHTSNLAIAREIALDHLMEFPDYYDRLEKAELE